MKVSMVVAQIADSSALKRHQLIATSSPTMYDKCFHLQQTQKVKPNNLNKELIGIKERSNNEQIMAAEKFVTKLVPGRRSAQVRRVRGR